LAFWHTGWVFDTGRATGHLTTGGAEANLTAVIVALAKLFPSYAEGGLRALSAQPVFYASAESHLALLTIAQMAGLAFGSTARRQAEGSLQLALTGLGA
jgi:aromatic-L-amino-acid/L-tryptophan decarboxylase